MRIMVLDHGYIELVETWGSDERIIEAARMSTGKGFQGWGGTEPCGVCDGRGMPIRACARHLPGGNFPRSERCDQCVAIEAANGFATKCHACGGSGKKPGDEKLLRFLLENKRSTPFEMAGATFEIQAPIFVFREWHRHRTQSYNEMSARYTPLPDLNYIPSVERLMLNAIAGGKQSGAVTGSVSLTEARAEEFRFALHLVYDGQEQLYQDALSWGVPKELARVHLPVGRYSRMRASANLRNWLAFLTLRSTAKGPGAQWEIRQYADALHGMLSEKFPRTITLFDGGTP